MHVLLHTLGIEHMSHHAATVDFIDLSTILQVNHGVFRPGILTLACPIDGRQIAFDLFVLVRPYWRTDVHVGVERAALVVVAAKDGAVHYGLVAAIVDVGLIDIAGWEDKRTVSPAEDVSVLFFVLGLGTVFFYVLVGLFRVQPDGGFLGYVNHRAAGDTFVVTAAKDIANLATKQVDDS